MNNGNYPPKLEHKFTFGVWTVGSRGRDPFGDAVRPALPPAELVRLLAEVGAYGVNFHDNDLVPIDATSTERDRFVREFKNACGENGIKVPMTTVNLFYEAVFRDGAFTANDAQVRRSAPYRKRSGSRTLRPGPSFRVGDAETGFLAREIPGGRRLRRHAAFRCPRLPDGRL